MSTLKGYNSNPKTLSGIVDVVADTAQVGGIVIDNSNIDGISNFNATDITCTNLTATNISGGNIVYTSAEINDLIVNNSTLVKCDMNLTTGYSYNIANIDILNESTLGSSVVNSSLTSVGVLTGLTVSGNMSGTLTTPSQPNIRSLGTLSSLTVSGNINQSSGTASLFRISCPDISGTITSVNQPNITGLGTLSSLTVSGNINQPSGTASLFRVSCSDISGLITTSTQPNITGLGTLSSLTVSGNINQSSGTASLNQLQVLGDTLLKNTGVVGSLQVIDNNFVTEVDVFPAKKDTVSDGNYVTYKIDNGTPSKYHYFLNQVEVANTLSATTVSGRGTLSTLTVSGDLTVDTNTLRVDSSNNRVGVVKTLPLYPLDVTGDINSTGVYRVNNNQVLSATALGGGVLSSSLTSVGTLSSLSVSGNITVSGLINHGSTTFRPGVKGSVDLSSCETIGTEQVASSFANLTFTSDSQFGYTMSSTSNAVSPVTNAYMAFGSASGQWGSLTNYNNLGVYTGSASIVSSGTTYTGERVQIQFPSTTVLKSWTFSAPINANGSWTKDYVLIGGDGTTWATLATGTAVQGSNTVTFTSGFGVGYNYFVLCIRTLTVATSGTVARATANNTTFTGWTFPSVTQSVYVPQSLEVGRTSLPNSLPGQALTVNGNSLMNGLLYVQQPTFLTALQVKPGYKRNDINPEYTTYEMPGTRTHLFWDNVQVNDNLLLSVETIPSGFNFSANGFARFRLPCFWVYRTGSWTANTNSSIVSNAGTVSYDFNPAYPATGTGWNTSVGMYGVGASTTGMVGVYHFDVYVRAVDTASNIGVIPQVYNSLSTARANVIRNADGTWWVATDGQNRRTGTFSCNVTLNANDNFLVTPNSNTMTWQEIQVSGHFVSHLG